MPQIVYEAFSRQHLWAGMEQQEPGARAPPHQFVLNGGRETITDSDGAEYEVFVDLKGAQQGRDACSWGGCMQCTGQCSTRVLVACPQCPRSPT